MTLSKTIKAKFAEGASLKDVKHIIKRHKDGVKGKKHCMDAERILLQKLLVDGKTVADLVPFTADTANGFERGWTEKRLTKLSEFTAKDKGRADKQAAKEKARAEKTAAREKVKADRKAAKDAKKAAKVEKKAEPAPAPTAPADGTTPTEPAAPATDPATQAPAAETAPVVKRRKAKE
jgi:hypothetical protein